MSLLTDLSQQTLEYFDNPCNVGYLDVQRRNVGTGLAGVPGQSDVVQLQLQVDPAQAVIEQVVFKAHGSAHLIAAGEFVSAWLQGKMLDAVQAVDSVFIASTLELPPTKQYCALLVSEALQKAMLDYQEKVK